MSEALGVRTLFIEPGSPRGNSNVESFTGKLRNELLDPERAYTLAEAKILIEGWRRSTTRYGRTVRWAIVRHRPRPSDRR